MRPCPILSRLFLSGLTIMFLTNTSRTRVFAEDPGGSTIQLPGHTDPFGDPLPEYAWGRLGTVRWRHGRYVISVAYHPHGRTLVSTAADGSVRVWDAANGKELRRLEGHGGDVQWIAFDRKGDKVAAVSETRDSYQLLLWDYRTGKRLWLQRVEEPLSSVAFSPDDTTLATGGLLDNAYIWDAKTGEKRARFFYEKLPNKCHHAGIVSFSRDGRLLACGGANGKGYIWDTASGEKVWSLDVEDASQVMLFSPGGKLLVSVASRDQLALWDVASRKQVGTIPSSDSFFQFSPDAKLLVVGEFGDMIHNEGAPLSFWDVSTRKKVGTAKWRYPASIGGSNRFCPFAFSPDGKRLAWGGADHRVHLLDVATGVECPVSREPHCPIESLAYSPDGRILALGCADNAGFDHNIYLWRLTPLKLWKAYYDKEPVWSLAFSPDGKNLAVGTAGLQLREPATGKYIRLDKDADELGWINNLLFSPDGSRLICGTRREVVHLWDVKRKRESCQFRTSAHIYALAVSPNGRWLAGGDKKSSVYVWDLTINKEVEHFAAHQGWLRAAAFSPDGRTLATGGEGQTILVWEMASGKTCLRLNCDEEVRCLAFSHDGRFMASSGKDKAISLWELATGKRVARLIGHQGTVSSLAFSPDGNTLATASDDTTALLWHWQEAIPRQDSLASPLTSQHLQQSWKDLASRDARIAYRAIWKLAAVPEQAVSLLREHLAPIAMPDALRIARLIADLNSDSFIERNQAMRELQSFGELVEMQLRKALTESGSEETRRRAKELLTRLESPLVATEKLQFLRALIVLEQTKTPASIALVKKIATGAPGARVTQEAHTVLDRLEKRKDNR